MIWTDQEDSTKKFVGTVLTLAAGHWSCCASSGAMTHSHKHFLYWNLKAAVWNDDGDYAVLFEVSGWDHKRVGAS